MAGGDIWYNVPVHIVSKREQATQGLGRDRRGARKRRAPMIPAALLALLAITTALLGGCIPTATAGQVDSPAAVTAAATRYVRSNSAITDFTVQVEAMDAGYARVRISAITVNACPTIAFLKRQHSDWIVLGMGAFFVPEFYERHKIPESVQMK